MDQYVEEYVPVIIVLKSHDELTQDCLPRWTVSYLKWKIREKTKIYPSDQRLFLEGIEMDEKEPEYTLSTYGIEKTASATIQYRIVLMERYTGIPQTYFLDESIFDHKWDCSFEGITDKRGNQIVLHKRGKESYLRPLGCVRYGVKVLGKYPDDRWLGGKGYRAEEEEWPVAYHGTKEVNVLDILKNGFKLEKGVRFAFGKGIYCTPDPKVAMAYAFDYSFNEKPYKLIIQCRVDPQKLQIVARGVNPGGFTGTSAGAYGDYWLVPDGSAIRPYGICVFPAVSSNSTLGSLNTARQQPQAVQMPQLTVRAQQAAARTQQTAPRTQQTAKKTIT